MTDSGDKEADTSSQEGQYSKEVAAVVGLLSECGVTEYDPRVVSMLMDIQYSITSKILETAGGLSRHQDKQRIDSEDIQMAADMIGVLGNQGPNREKLLQLAQDKNAQPLPAIRHNYGLKLPNDRFCQLQPNVVYRAEEFGAPAPQHHPHPSHIIEPPTGVYRNEQVQNMLKRRAPEDDFDS